MWSCASVADLRLEYDGDVKAPIYATAGIPEFWLADLNANILWRYSSPERGAYSRAEEYRRDESIAPLLLPNCVIAVDALLTE